MAKIAKKGSSESRAPLMTVEQRERLKREIASGDSLVGEEEGRGIVVDESKGSGKSKRLQRLADYVERCDPANRKLTGPERQKAFEEMKALEAWFPEHMLTQSQMSMFPSRDYSRNQDYSRAITRSMKQEVGSKEFQEKASRYKYLARVLEPDDPELPNLE